MTAEAQNFKMRAGEVKDLRFTIDNPEGVDLTGVTGRWWAAPASAAPAANPPPAVTPSIQKGSLAVTVTNGVATVTVPLERADTINLVGDYYHELSLDRTLPLLAQTAATGMMTVKRSIIRP